MEKHHMAKSTTMNDKKPSIESFFTAYEKRFNDALKADEADIEGHTDAFTDCFVGAGPKGTQCFKNNDDLKASIPKMYAFYKSIGTESMKILSKEITTLTEYHSLVKIYWQSQFIKRDHSLVTIEFENFYLVQTLDNKIKIFSYVTGDEEGAYREHGIEPYR
jgi:hypothetical protein